MRAKASTLWYKMCTYDFLTNIAKSNMVSPTDGYKNVLHIVNTFRVTHLHTQLMKMFLALKR